MAYRCPVCGKLTEYRQELNGLCEECYARLHGLRITLREKPVYKVIICAFCRKMKFGKGWVALNSKNLGRTLEQQAKKLRSLKGFKPRFDIKEELITQLLSEGEAEIDTVAVYNGIEAKRIKSKVKVQWAICPICRRKREGHYYEVVIHVRISDKGKKAELERMLREVSRLVEAEPSEVVDIKKISKGADIKVSSSRLGEEILRRVFKDAIYVRQYWEKEYDKALQKQINVRKILIEI